MSSKAEIEKGPTVGQRHAQAFLIFLSIVVNYMARYNASVAIVAMTDPDSTSSNYDEFEWTEMQRSYILSSFFWGYTLTQFLGGWLSRQLGSKITMFISTFGSALLALLPPFCVSWGGWQAFCIIRVGMGMFQGFLFPCIHTHLASWSPAEERNRLGGLANSGIECGVVLSILVSGIVAASSMGWPGISYISCGVGLCWCIVWIIFGASKPRESKFISKTELDYIEHSLNLNNDSVSMQSAIKIPIPWRAIFTSVPLIALMIARCSASWGFSTLQAQIPAYMNGVLLMDMKSNAVFSALPYFASLIMAFVYLIISDIMLTRQVFSLATIRKSINTVALWVPAIGLIAVGFVGSDQKTLAVVLITISVGFNAGTTLGSTINTIDLSPNHAGILMGIVNTAENVISFLTPLFVGIVVTDEHSRSQWQIVFAVTACFFFVGNIVYIIWGRADIQAWDAEDFLTKNEKVNEDCQIKCVDKQE